MRFSFYFYLLILSLPNCFLQIHFKVKVNKLSDTYSISIKPLITVYVMEVNTIIMEIKTDKKSA